MNLIRADRMLPLFEKLVFIVARPLGIRETFSALLREMAAELDIAHGAVWLALGSRKFELCCCVGKGSEEWAARMGETLEELSSLRTPTMLRDSGSCRFLIPISPAEIPAGLVVMEQVPPCRWEETHQDFLRFLGLLLEVALEKAQLYEGSNLLHSLRDVDVTALDMNALLPEIYRQVARVLDAPDFYIALYDKERNYLDVSFIIEDGEKGERRFLPLAQAGLAGWIIEHRQPLLIQNWKEEKHTLPASETLFRGAAASWMGVPLMIKGRVTGVVVLQSPLPGAFTEGKLRLLESLADQLALLIENTNLYERFKRQVRGFETLQKIQMQLSSSSDWDKALKTVLESLQAALDIDAAWVALYDPAKEKLVAFSAWPAFGNGNTGKFGHAILLKAIQNGIPFILDGPEEVEEFAKDLETVPFKAALAFPFRKGSDIFGACGVAFKTIHPPTQEELYITGLLAAQAATAFENLKLLREREERITQLELLHMLSQIAVNSLSIESLVSRSVEILERMQPVEAGLILLKEDGEFKHTLHWGPKGELLLSVDPNEIQSLLADGHPRIVKDGFRVPPGLEMRSALIAPIATARETMGLMVLINRLDDLPFNEEDLLLIGSVTTMLTGTLEKIYLHQQTEIRLTEMVTLYAISQQINSSLELSTVLETIVSVIKHVMDCRGACIFLLNKDTGWLEIRAASGLTSRWRKEAKLRVGEGISGKVVATGRPVYVPDTYEDPDFIFFDRSVRSLLVVPLVVKDRVIGTLSIDDIKPNAFTPDDERFLSIVASQAAIAIENASLYEALKERAEVLKRAYEEMSELSRMKTEFVQNISHELRTPLTFIKGYVELLLEKAMGPLTNEQREALEVVSEKADVITRLVEDIVLLQKAETGKLNLAPVSLEEIAHLSIQGAAVAARQAGIEFKLEAEPNLPPVLGDKTRLTQVFDNLISNAIKFSPEGGIITVRLKDVGDFVQAEVQDQGIGIPEDKLDKIFERFYQVDGSPTRRFGGMGLGLAIVKSIVEAHGGRVWVESKVGEGSTFYFTIPKAKPA